MHQRALPPWECGRYCGELVRGRRIDQQQCTGSFREAGREVLDDQSPKRPAGEHDRAMYLECIEQRGEILCAIACGGLRLCRVAAAEAGAVVDHDPAELGEPRIDSAPKEVDSAAAGA